MNKNKHELWATLFRIKLAQFKEKSKTPNNLIMKNLIKA